METLKKFKTDFITKVNKPHNAKQLKKIPLVTGYALVVSMASLTFLLIGAQILIETGVPKIMIVRGIGILLVICGLGCAGSLFPGIARIMNK